MSRLRMSAETRGFLWGLGVGGLATWALLLGSVHETGTPRADWLPVIVGPWIGVMLAPKRRR